MRRYTKKHPGIRIDKIIVYGGPGLVFAAGVVAIFLLGLPQLRALALVSLVGGAAVAGWLYFWHNQTRW